MSERESPSSPAAGDDDPASDDAVAQIVAWEHAEAHALAAASLLDDPSVPPWTAAQHLRDGFTALARAAGVADPALARLDASALPWLGSPQALGDALQTLGGDDDDAQLDPAPLRQLSLALSTAVRNAQDERFAPRRRRELRRRLRRRVLVGLMVLVPFAVALVLTVPDYREGPWRAEVYATKDFSGPPSLRRDGDLKFDWARSSPSPEIPDDAFSVRWDTCLELPEDLEIAFQLISDDGSRLWVDGELFIDNWGRHGERSRGADVPLRAGMHHLRVEYYDERHSASVELRASLHGERPDSLPVRLLHYPGDSIDPDDPCAGVDQD